MSVLEYKDWNEIAENPECSQIMRDFARTKLSEGRTPSDQWSGYSLDPIWVETIESCERYGFPSLSDTSMIKIASKVLLLDEHSDGCKSVNAIMLPNGQMDTLGAYPKLVKACRKVIKETSMIKEKCPTKRDLAADANIALASLLNMEKVVEGGRSKAEKYFKDALVFRPNDWKIHSACSAMYMKCSSISQSLDSLSRAIELVKSPKASFDLSIKKGKLLSQLSRHEEAITILEEVMEKYEAMKDELSDKDKGHATIAHFALCWNYSLSRKSNRYKKMLKHWKGAEAKRNQLSSDTIARLNWDFRDIAQMAVASVKPNLALSHRECHYCHKVTDDVKTCSACKAAVYCSKECQVKAWKGGHKLECKKAKVERKKEKEEMKKPKKPVKFVDELLVPENLFKKGVKLLEDGDAEEAAWNFLVALFMDFSLDAPHNIPPMQRCVNQCPRDNVVAMVLGMVSNHHGDYLGKCEQVLNTLSSQTHGTADLSGYDIYEDFKDVNRDSFAYGVALVFSARWKNRMFDLKRGIDRNSNYNAYHKLAEEIIDAKGFINPEQWLTFQFELGYSQYDIGAMEEGSYWLQRFVDNLNSIKKKNGRLAPHYETYKGSAEQKLYLMPFMKQAQNMFGSAF